MPVKIKCLLPALFLFAGALHAQQAVFDSLKTCLAKAPNDSLRWYYAVEISARYIRTNFDSSKVFGEKALRFSEQTASQRLVGTSLNSLGATYWAKGDLETALQYYFKSLEISQARKLRKLESTTLANIGIIYTERKDMPRAFGYLKKSLAVKTEIRDTLGMMRTLNNLGEAYINANMPDSALLFLRQCLPLFDHQNQPFGKGIVLSNLGNIFLTKKDYAQARLYFNQSLAIREKIDDKGGMATLLGNLSDMAREEGKTGEALALLNRALPLARQTGSQAQMADLYNKFALAYAVVQDYPQAYRYLQDYTTLRDSLAQKANEEKIAEMEVKYQTQQKEADLAQKQLQLERQTGQKRLILGGSLLVLLILFGFFQYLRNRQRARQQQAALALQLEHAEAEKLRELDRLRSIFFANISHEFRTPLTLIVSPLEQLLRGGLQDSLQKYYGIMLRNARRLLELVNQLLDLSKLEAGKMQLQVSQSDLGQFVRAIAYAFESLAVRKQIHFEVQTPEAPVSGWFDRDKVEKILNNLISNAFKFTPEEGTVRVELHLQQDQAVLQVRDSGIGIPEEQLPHLFERFYKSTSGSDLQAGSGIGLALTRELVELHRGHIMVESRQGDGTQFTVVLPLDKTAYAGAEFLPEAPATAAAETYAAPMPREPEPVLPAAKGGKDTVLVVEDNDDVRQYIREQLVEHFHVVEAANGAEGLRRAQTDMPNLVITDLMMPDMDGLALTQNLKTDLRTSHIPVIMLTAKASQEEKIEGLQTGADVYLTKPFDARELQVQATGLIRQRRLLRERYAQAGLLPSEVAVNAVDETFLAQIRQAIEENMDDETFGVVELSQKVALSRSQLHRKLKALTGHGPNEIVRHMRLERAKELLEKRAGNASEVAFQVGFNSLAYFSKCFSDYFGYSPSELK